MTFKVQLFLFLGFLPNFLIGQVISYPERMWADTIHAPFWYGVASGDPSENDVWLWTRAEDSLIQDSLLLNWELDDAPDFLSPIQTGQVYAMLSDDFTVKVRVSGLQAGTSYHYRFGYNGSWSDTGKTKTLPSGNTSKVQLAVFSCSSIYSGFYNAFRHLAGRNDIDACVHLGDYVYEFPDGDELVRMPVPSPQVPNSLISWRELHKYNLLDPDLRAARKNHPWISIWDNHDINNSNGANPSPGSIQAFQEYLPIRVDTLTAQNILYKSYDFGDLVRLSISDIMLFRTQDTLFDGSYNIQGNKQFDFQCKQLREATQTWKIMSSQKMFGGWYTYGVPDLLLNLIPNDGAVFSNNGWDGFITNRNMLIDTLRINQINNFVSIAGDAHFSVAMDVVKNPRDSLEYNPLTGNGASGLDFLPTSITRGNFDEAGIPPSVMPTFYGYNEIGNPHHVYIEGVEHGYGTLEFTPDSLTATYWYFPVLQIATQPTSIKVLKAVAGENHWIREASPISSRDISGKDEVRISPNPASTKLQLSWIRKPERQGIFSLDGRLVSDQLRFEESVGGQSGCWEIGILPQGVYLWFGETSDAKTYKLFVKM